MKEDKRDLTKDLEISAIHRAMEAEQENGDLREKLKKTEGALEGAEATMVTLQQILKRVHPGLWDSVDDERVTRIKKALAAIRGEEKP